MRKNKLIFKKARAAALLLLLTSGLIALNGCSSKEVMVTKPETENTTVETQSETSEGIPVSTESENQSVTEEQSGGEKPATEQTEEPVSEPGETDTVKEPELTHLIGLTKDELKQEIKEEPSVVDEGGLEFKDYGIRAWFDNDSKVNQIYLLNNDIEIDGIKTGDNIAEFKKAFGEPIKDENGDAHFKYKDYFLSVNYDTKTQETFSVYLLKEDF